MRHLIMLACAGVCMLSLTACNATLSNISRDCDRDYDGTVEGGLTGASFHGTIKMHCEHEFTQPAPPTPSAPPPAAP